MAEPSGPQARRGFVLPVLLLVLLGLTLLLHGSLALVRIQERSMTADGLRLRARLLAEGEVRRAAARRLPVGVDANAPASGRILAERADGGEATVVRLRRLDPEWILLEGEARVRERDLAARVRTARPLWVLDGRRRLRAATAAVEAPEPPAGAGRIDGSTVAASPPGWPPEVCAPHRAVLDSLFAGRELPDWRPLDAPETPPVEGPSSGAPALGLLDGGELLRRAELRPGGTVRPAPALRFGACDATRTDNWGSPSDPGGPCGDLHRLVGADGPLRVEGGEGQGVLVVDDDLTLTGHHFLGVVLVGGRLRLEGGARILGLVRAAGPVTVAPDASVEAAGCPVLRSLRAVQELARPVLPPGMPWIGPT